MPGFAEVALRAVVTYITLLAVTRLMGKREISQMTFLIM